MRIRVFNRIAMAAIVLMTAIQAISCSGKEEESHIPSPAELAASHKGPTAVYIGDSITWQWGTNPREISKDKIVIPLSPLPSWLEDKGNNVKVSWRPEFFSLNNYVDKGISAQNTTQILARFQSDVVNLDPHCVVIMAGTNDLAQGVSKEQIMKNLSSMAEMASNAGIKVILCSVTPCNMSYSKLYNPNTKGAHILKLNEQIREYAKSKKFTYCDYYPALVAEDGLSLRDEFCLYDKLHPNPDAYVEMEKIIKPIIEAVTK